MKYPESRITKFMPDQKKLNRYNFLKLRVEVTAKEMKGLFPKDTVYFLKKLGNNLNEQK